MNARCVSALTPKVVNEKIYNPFATCPHYIPFKNFRRRIFHFYAERENRFIRRKAIALSRSSFRRQRVLLHSHSQMQIF